MADARSTCATTIDPVDCGVVLMPVKDFARAKTRLAPALEPEDRARLAESMASHVVRAQGATPVVVCCDEDSVARWAERVGAKVIWCPGTDLNGAVQQGFEQARAGGYRSVAITHSDLPRAVELAPMFGWPGVTIVPDRHRTGTNVMVLPAALDFEFMYGADSFGRHVAEAVRLRKGLKVVHDPNLAWDVDEPGDLTGADHDVLRLLERNPHD